MKIKFAPHLLTALIGSVSFVNSTTPIFATESTVTVYPDKTKQTIWGIGFEIQSDSINSGNQGLSEEPIAVPHDLIPSERERLANEMLKGFRYCRLAGGLYWRGLDAQQKFLQPRWPEQLQELKQLLDTAGVEGLSFEYWSPAPFWKANRAYIGKPNSENIIRCFGKDFAHDPDYKGDTDRFLGDFANAVVADIQTLQKSGLKTSMMGLQNEPDMNGSSYPQCKYKDSPSYVKTYVAVAKAIRAYDPKIILFADTASGFPKYIGPAMKDPAVASLVDAYVVHTVGGPSEAIRGTHSRIRKELPARPWFQNEYEYLTGGTTPARCLNTVQHIMDSFQIGENPTWFWIHCLKPMKNAEASGYSLGFWKSLIEQPKMASAVQFRRWIEGPEFTQLPDELKTLEMVSAKVKDPTQQSINYNFLINQPVTIYLVAEDVSELKLSDEWQPTELTTAWEGGKDKVFKREFPKGKVEIPASKGKVGDRYAPPHLVFVKPSNPATFKAEIGVNIPMQVRSEAIALEQKVASVQPGHWIYNPYNWNAVGSFVKHMPWDCVAVAMDESGEYQKDARILAFKRPNGKLTVVVSNRGKEAHTFTLNTNLEKATWKGFRYTPDVAGDGTMGVPVSSQNGATLKPTLEALSWEFWEQE